MREPAKGKVASTSKDRASTPPPPDIKKVLAKDYEPGLSGKYKGKKTNLDEDGDEAENEAVNGEELDEGRVVTGQKTIYQPTREE